MLSSAEEAGRLELGLSTISKTCQLNLDTQLERLSALFEPAIVIFMGVIVGGISLMFFLPMTRVLSQL